MKHILLTISLLFCMTANAAYIVESSPGVVTAVGDLDIDGTLYNVDFEAANGAFSTFGGNEFFWADEASTTAAIIAINATLENALGGAVPKLNNLFQPVFSITAAYAIWAGPTGNLGAIAGVLDGVGSWTIDPTPYPFPTTYFEVNSSFGTAWSVAEVPLPGASWLFLSALGGLIGRKKLARK